jgi:hypothetical protein
LAAYKTLGTLILSLLVFSVAVPFASGIGRAVAATNSPTASLTKTGTGLNYRDSLISSATNCNGGGNATSSINKYWFIYGDAPLETGASWTACEGNTGLWLGVQSAGSAQWAGIFAESPRAYVMVYHTHLVLPSATIKGISGNAFNTGLYVQTSAPMVNYAVCYGQVVAGGEYGWGAVLSTGNANQATSYQQLWTGPTFTNGGPSSEDCTIVTNGSNLLQIYMNGTLVYSNTHDNLNMPAPFNAYIEVETSDTSQMLWASYQDYYATTSNAVTVTNLPAGDVAEIVSGSTVLASATNGGTSPATVSVNIAQYNMPIAGALEVLSGSDSVLATTGSVSFWGGDSYQFNDSNTTTTTTSSLSSSSSSTSTSTTSSPSYSSTSSSTASSTTTSSSITSSISSSWTTSGTSPLTIDSQNAAGSPIVGYYTVLYSSAGTSLGTGFTPVVFTLTNGGSYQVLADSYGVCTFSNWSGASVTGSTADPVSISITGPTTITAVYTGPSCGGTTTTTSSTRTTTLSSTTTISTIATSSTTSTRSSSTASTTAQPPSLTVESVDQNGQSITGYWNVLRVPGGGQVGTGYTPRTYTGLTPGVTYTIELDSYAQCQFSHWQDTENTTSLRTFTQTSGSMTFIGVFNCTGSSAGAMGQSVPLGLAVSTLLSEFAIPIGMLSVAFGGLFTAHTKVRFMMHDPKSA